MSRRLACTLVLLALAGGTVNAAVRASLDNNRIGPGDTVQLTLQRDGQTNAQPDLAPLKQDFDVLSVGSSDEVQIINGSISSQTVAQIELSPKHTGQLTVPSINWGGESSPALSLTVGGGATAGAGTSSGSGTASAAAGSPVFVQTVVDNTHPYVQAAVDVTVRVYTTEQLYQASLNFPADNDVLMQQVGGDTHSTAFKNGQQYDVVERHYLIFPQRSGTLQIPGAVLAGQVAVRLRDDPYSDDPFANFFGGAAGVMNGTKPIRVHGDPITLEVRPRPAGSGSGAWLPAQKVTVTGKWRPQSLHVPAGDPITLDLSVTADGLTAPQLPNVAAMLALPPGLHAYPDQAKLSTSAQGDVVVGTRDQSLALIADHAGRYVLPALHLSWWNTQTDQAQTADLPAQTIEVQPVPGGAASAAAPTAGSSAPIPSAASAGARHAGMHASKQDQRWILLSAGLGLLWVVTLLGWWISRRRAPAVAQRLTPVMPAQAPLVPPASTVPAASTVPTSAAALSSGPARPPNGAPPSASRARAQFQDACRRSDAAAARRSLMAWAAAAWPDAHAAGLGALAKRFADPRVGEALAELDRACYAGAAWEGGKLAQLLQDLPKPGARGTQESPIAPLYR